MDIAIITNIRSPYRKLQIEEFTKIPNININVYYTNRDIIDRKWNVGAIQGVNEKILNCYIILRKFSYINSGLINIVKNNEIIAIGGYEQPTYVLLSLLCSFFKKPYIIIFDGISPKKVDTDENQIKYLLKKLVITHASSIFRNGSISKIYFNHLQSG